MVFKLFRSNPREEDSKPSPNGNTASPVLSEQRISAPPTLSFSAWARERRPDSIQTEFLMTIHNRVTRLTDKQAAMLMKVCTVLALRDGIDFTLYLALEHLRSHLTRNGHKLIEEVQEERDRQALLLSELVLLNFRGEWHDMQERIRIPEAVVVEILHTGWLPDRRTFHSWMQHWQPEKFLEFRIVPVEYLLERAGFSEPYSAYCKGYGEGGHPSRNKTRYSAELDGEDFEVPPPRFNLLEVQRYQVVLNAIEAAKAIRMQGNR